MTLFYGMRLDHSKFSFNDNIDRSFAFLNYFFDNFSLSFLLLLSDYCILWLLVVVGVQSAAVALMSCHWIQQILGSNSIIIFSHSYKFC